MEIDQKIMEEFDNFSWIQNVPKVIKTTYLGECSRIIGTDDNQFNKFMKKMIVGGFDINGALLNQNIDKGFPGSLAVTILRKDFPLLSSRPYRILPKTDGIRFFLCFMAVGEKPDIKRFCFLLNRNNQFYIISMHGFPESIYEGTIFDGELVELENEKYQYQIFDCLSIFGKSIFMKTHIERLNQANFINTINLKKFEKSEKSESNLASSKFNPFEIILKHYITNEEANKLKFDKSSKLDGIILINSESSYKFGKDTELFKLKKIDTVDFKLKLFTNPKQKKICKYFTSNSKQKNTLQFELEIPDNWLKHFDDPNNEYIKTNVDLLDSKIVECFYDKIEKIWYPYRLRNDKLYANNVKTFNLTLSNIQENIQLEEIIIELQKQKNNN
jgi:hypothetical protein